MPSNQISPLALQALPPLVFPELFTVATHGTREARFWNISIVSLMPVVLSDDNQFAYDLNPRRSRESELFSL